MTISRCGAMGMLSHHDWMECAEFFKMVNDWFDVLNVQYYATDTRERTKAYGLALTTQNNIANLMTTTILNLRVKGKTTLLPSQEGIIMTNTSLELLFTDLKERFGTKYLLTYRLNQGVIENFFGVIRAKGGLHDRPNALEFKYRLRSYIIGTNENNEDITPDVTMEDLHLCAKYFSSFTIDENFDEDVSTEHELKDREYDGLENLAGYICHKLKQPEKHLKLSDSNEYNWLTHSSEGGLTKPSPKFMVKMVELKKIFKSANYDSLLICKNYLKGLLQKSGSVDCSDKTKMLFFRSRMYFRMRELNRNMHQTNGSVSRKRKPLKTVK